MQTFADLGSERSSSPALTGFNSSTHSHSGTSDPMALEGADVIACARRVWEKPQAYGIPLVERLMAYPKGKALCCAHSRTRSSDCRFFEKGWWSTAANWKLFVWWAGLTCGGSFRLCGARHALSWPLLGRLADHLRRRSLSLMETEMLILDEGDRMLEWDCAPVG